jgi:fucose permease
MDVETLLDSVTNGTQATDALSNAVANPSLAHLKAASIVIFFMLCRDLGKFVIPRILEKLTSTSLATLASPSEGKKDL